MNHTRLFEELLLELQVLINSPLEYDQIKSSRVLRQLLIDGDALVHLVNRELRASPSFTVQTDAPARADNFYPEIYPAAESVESAELRLQDFLKHSVGTDSQGTITVRDVIKYAAIVLGGVHFKEAESSQYRRLAEIHNARDNDGTSHVLTALRHIGAVTRDAIIPIRDRLLKRERFERGQGWTVILSLRLLPAPPDEENFILDVGANENANRFSVYVDARQQLTFRIVDSSGSRRYLRTGLVGGAVPIEKPIILVCELSTVDDETLLSIRTDGWDHAEVVRGVALQDIGNPFHFVTGSDCLGKKRTFHDEFGSILIARPLSILETAQSVAYFSEKAASATHWVSFLGNQFLYSGGHPNFEQITG
jgi:hypothetical protein